MAVTPQIAQKTTYEKIDICITPIFLFNCYSCGKEKKEIEHVIAEVEEKVIDFYNFKHYLEDSNYAYYIKITIIIATEHKDMFEIEKEKYGVPEKINGTFVTIEFEKKKKKKSIFKNYENTFS